MAKKSTKRVTAKQVQTLEDLPAPKPLPVVVQKPEVDDGPWEKEGMTLRQRRFCEAYVGEAGGNGTKAAQLAGYSDDNLNALGVTATENLRKPNVRSYIGRLFASVGLTQDYLRGRLAQLCQSSMDNFLTINAEGEVELDMKAAAAMGALGQVKEYREETFEIDSKVIRRKRMVKLHDPLPALRTLLEMQGLLISRHEHTGPNGEGIPLKFDYDGFARQFLEYSRSRLSPSGNATAPRNGN